MIDSCEWAPAHDVYTGTARTAIMAFTEIPLPVRMELIERAEKKTPEYSDLVTIRRDSIDGRNEYRSTIRNMHFGSQSRQCKSVTRLKWRDSDTQGAMVFCVDEWCVARPAVCNNWAIITRIAPPTRTVTLDEPVIFDAIPPGYIETIPQLSVPVLQDGSSGYAVAQWGGAEGFYGSPGWSFGPSVGIPCVACCLPPVVPVPEPATWLTMLAGLFFSFGVVWRMKHD